MSYLLFTVNNQNIETTIVFIKRWMDKMSLTDQ